MAKQRRLSFPAYNHVSNSIFDLIHCDIWGPFNIPTAGYKYFFTLVDDCSRFTWVYLMHHKSVVLTIVRRFFSMIETQFSEVIKVFRSDNAAELQFTKFFALKGTLHQFSCVARPEQNSVVEHKYQHILNVARALFFQLRVPIMFYLAKISIMHLFGYLVVLLMHPLCLYIEQSLIHGLVLVFLWAIQLGLRSIDYMISPRNRCSYHVMSTSLKICFHSTLCLYLMNILLQISWLILFYHLLLLMWHLLVLFKIHQFLQWIVLQLMCLLLPLFPLLYLLIHSRLLFHLMMHRLLQFFITICLLHLFISLPAASDSLPDITPTAALVDPPTTAPTVASNAHSDAGTVPSTTDDVVPPAVTHPMVSTPRRSHRSRNPPCLKDFHCNLLLNSF